MSSHHPGDRATIARIAAYTSWARTPDRRARTAPGTAASLARFELDVDPDGRLPEAERVRRAEFARKAYFTHLALLSAQARRHRRRAAQLAGRAHDVDAAQDDGGDDAA